MISYARDVGDGRHEKALPFRGSISESAYHPPEL
jgi:hypothetical protein